MTLKEELVRAYEQNDNTEEVSKACHEFFKPRLLDAATRQERNLFVDVQSMPEVLKRNLSKVMVWLTKEGLSYQRVGCSYLVVAGWSTPKSKGIPPDIINYYETFFRMF